MTKSNSICSFGSGDIPPIIENQNVVLSKLRGRTVGQIPVWRSDGSHQYFDAAKVLSQISIPSQHPSQKPSERSIERWDNDFADVYIPQKIENEAHEKVRPNDGDAYLDRLDQEGYKKIAVQPDGDCLYNAVLEGLDRLNPAHPLVREDAASLRTMVHAAIVSSDDFKESIITMLLGEVWDDVKRLALTKQDFDLLNVPGELKNKFNTFYNSCLIVGSIPENLERLDSEVLEWIATEGWMIYSQGIADGETFSGGVEAQILSRLFETPIRIHKVEENAKPFVQDVGEMNVPEDKVLHLLLTGAHYSLLLRPDQLDELDKESIRKKERADEKAEVITDYNNFRLKIVEDASVYNAVLEGIRRLRPDHEMADVDSETLKTLIAQIKPNNVSDLQSAWEKVKLAYKPKHLYPKGYEDKFHEFYKRRRKIFYDINEESKELDVLEKEVQEWICSGGADTQSKGKIVKDERVLKALSILFDTPIKIERMDINGRCGIQTVGDCSVPEENILHLRVHHERYALLIHPKQMLEEDKDLFKVVPLDQAKRDASPKRGKHNNSAG